MASSKVRLKDYESLKDTEDFKLYLNGVGVGISWANTALVNRGSDKIYCQPAKFSIGPENYLDILKREIDENARKYRIDTPVELILLEGLIKTFPCK